MKKQVQSQTDISDFETWRNRYDDDPWKIAQELPQDLWPYLPEAERFRQGRDVIKLLVGGGENLSQDALRKIVNLSKKQSASLHKALQDYYRWRGAKRRGWCYLPEPWLCAPALPAPVGLEIEIDNNSSVNWELRTYPTNRPRQLHRFLMAMRQVLFVLEDAELIPAGYEMNMHINLGWNLCQSDRWLLRGRSDLICYEQNPVADWVVELCFLLLLPNINQARLAFVLLHRHSGVVKRHRMKCDCDSRLHLFAAEISTTFSADYFLFSVYHLGRLLTRPKREAGAMLERISYVCRQYDFLSLADAKSRWNYLLRLSYRAYHELMYQLQGELVELFGDYPRD